MNELPEDRGSCMNELPEDRGSCTNELPEDRGSCTNELPEDRGSCMNELPEDRGSCTNELPEDLGSNMNEHPEEIVTIRERTIQERRFPCVSVRSQSGEGQLLSQGRSPQTERSTCCRFETWEISFTPLSLCLSKERAVCW